MNTLCICVMCDKPRGCNQTDKPTKFVSCEKCREIRENCLKKNFLETSIGGICYFCRIALILREKNTGGRTMLDRTIFECGMCLVRRYFYYRQKVVILRKKECGECRFRKTCPYFIVKAKRGVCPECTRRAKLCGLKKI